MGAKYLVLHPCVTGIPEAAIEKLEKLFSEQASLHGAGIGKIHESQFLVMAAFAYGLIYYFPFTSLGQIGRIAKLNSLPSKSTIELM
jgi:hypothetical protein